MLVCNIIKDMPKIRIDKEEAQEAEIVESVWDVKKIIGGLLILILLFIFGSYVYFPAGNEKKSASTLGVESNLSPTPPLPKKEDIQNVITNAKEVLSQITAENITSSGAAVQQIISDLQGLQGKDGAVGLVCNLICKDK